MQNLNHYKLIADLFRYPDENLINKVERLLYKAEQHCLISNSIKTVITIFPHVITTD